MSVKTSNDVMKQVLTRLSEDVTLEYLYSNKAGFTPGIDTIYYSGPYWSQEEIQAILESVLRGRWLSAGEKVAEFERGFSRTLGTKSSLMVNSGSSANLVMFASVKSKFRLTPENTQVITAAAGFPTTVNPAIQYGFVPTFVDVEDTTLNIDLDLLEAAIDRSKEHHVLTFAHVLGNPPDMDRLMDFVKQNDVIFLEDCCDAFGSKWNGIPLGSYGLMSSCSFYPSHHICTGEGGMVSTSDEGLADTMRRLAWWGRDCYCVGAANLLPNGTCKKRFSHWLDSRPDLMVDHKYVFSEIGYNLKPLDLQGAIGVAQLRKVDEIHSNRAHNYQKLLRIFQKYTDHFDFARVNPKSEVSWFGFPVFCKSRSLKVELVSHFEKSRIQTRNYFAGNLLCHPAYSQLGDWRRFERANRIYETVFFIGCHPALTDPHLQYIEDCLESFFNTFHS